MYNHNDHYLTFCILRSIVLIIQNVCRLGFLQLSTSEALWTVVKTLLHCQKRLLSFQNKQLLVFNDKQSTQYHKKYSGLMNETFWTRQLWERGCRENRWQIVSALCFCRKTSFKVILYSYLILKKMNERITDS